MTNELSRSAVKLLSKNWKDKKIKWFDIPVKIRSELKRFRIIDGKIGEDGFCKIDAMAYNELVKGKQMELWSNKRRKNIPCMQYTQRFC